MYEYPYAAMPDVESSLAGAGMAAVGGIVAIFLIFYIAYLAFALACYIFRSLGLYTIAKRRGIYSPWLAWVPVGNLWILGSISDQYQYVVMNRVKKRRNTLLGLSIATLILSLPIGIISGVTAAMGVSDSLAMLSGLVLVLTIFALAVLGIVSAVFYFMALYDLYTSCDPQYNVLFLVLSILFGVTEPFFLFFSRNKDVGMPPRRVEPQYQQTHFWEYEDAQWQPPQEPEYQTWEENDQ